MVEGHVARAVEVQVLSSAQNKHTVRLFRLSVCFISRKGKLMSTRIVLSQAIDGFLNLDCSARHLSPHTIADYRNALNKFIAMQGDDNTRDITTADIARFLSRQNVSTKTVLNYHIALSALWSWLVREGYAAENIVRKIPRPRPRILAIVPFTETEIKAMLSSLRRNPERDKAMLLLLLDTGLRVSELCGLQREDVDLHNQRVRVIGKGDKERFVAFSPRTGAALLKALQAQPGPPFPGNRSWVAHLISGIGKRAGVKGVHPHRFRHTFAISYLRNGGNPYALPEILGHTTMEMTRRYAKLAQIDLDDALRRASPVDRWRL